VAIAGRGRGGSCRSSGVRQRDPIAWGQMIRGCADRPFYHSTRNLLFPIPGDLLTRDRVHCSAIGLRSTLDDCGLRKAENEAMNVLPATDRAVTAGWTRCRRAVIRELSSILRTGKIHWPSRRVRRGKIDDRARDAQAASA